MLIKMNSSFVLASIQWSMVSSALLKSSSTVAVTPPWCSWECFSSAHGPPSESGSALPCSDQARHLASTPPAPGTPSTGAARTPRLLHTACTWDPPSVRRGLFTSSERDGGPAWTLSGPPSQLDWAPPPFPWLCRGTSLPPVYLLGQISQRRSPWSPLSSRFGPLLTHPGPSRITPLPARLLFRCLSVHSVRGPTSLEVWNPGNFLTPALWSEGPFPFYHYMGIWSDDSMCNFVRYPDLPASVAVSIVRSVWWMVLRLPYCLGNSPLAYQMPSPSFKVAMFLSLNHSARASPRASSLSLLSHWRWCALKSPHQITSLPAGSLPRSSRALLTCSAMLTRLRGVGGWWGSTCLPLLTVCLSGARVILSWPWIVLQLS